MHNMALCAHQGMDLSNRLDLCLHQEQLKTLGLSKADSNLEELECLG